MIGTLLSALDGVLAFLPDWFRIALYGGLTGAGAMLLYGWLSPQEQLEGIQRALAEARRRVSRAQGEDVREVGRLVKASVALAVRQFALVLVPTVLAAVPVLVAIAWLQAAYSHTLPSPGTPVTVEYRTPSGVEAVAASPVSWPAEAEPVTLESPGGDPLLTLPLEHPRARITRRSWWHDVFANPAGYLPDDTRVRVVGLGLPERHILHFGPDWFRGWQPLFLAFLAVAAVAVKEGRGIR